MPFDFGRQCAYMPLVTLNSDIVPSGQPPVWMTSPTELISTSHPTWKWWQCVTPENRNHWTLSRIISLDALTL